MADDKQIRIAVIMAGGSGERFWPLSRKHMPKQLLRLTSSTESMLSEAVRRIAPLIPAKHVYVQTMGHLLGPIREAGVGITPENVIAEPCKRNTAGCIAYATAHMLAKYGGDGSNISMAILTSDHLITDSDAFCETVATALRTAEEEEALVTIGVPPTRPATGYGYIESAGAADAQGPQPVAAFREKPDAETAQQYLERGGYYWNSGMFFWRISTYLKELERVAPPMARAVRDMAEAMKARDAAGVERIFEQLEDISIDYALMEKAANVAMAPASFSWDDVGAWDALDRTRPRDAAGNVVEGDAVVVDCSNTIVYNDNEPGAVAVSVVGLDNVVVVATRDAVLVVNKDRTEDVKKAVALLKERNARQV